MEFKSSLDNLVKRGDPAVEKETAFLELVASKGFEMEELAPIIKSKGKTVLYATAGAGKSTALSLIYAKDKSCGLLSQGKQKEGIVWVTTFLKSGSEELEQSIHKMLAKLGMNDVLTSDTQFKTLHAEFRTLLGLLGFNLSDKSKPDFWGLIDGGSDEEQRKTDTIMKRIFRKYNLGSEKGSSYVAPAEINMLKNIVSRYRNTVYSDYVFGEAEEDAKRLGLTLNMLPGIVQTYQELKERNRLIDYDDMMTWVYDFLVNPKNEDDPALSAWLDYYKSRYSYILLDEAQDMSELQYQVMKPIFENCPRVVLVGDPDQSIYGFRGSNHETMSWFERDFKPSVYPLSVSYRCPSNIMEPIAKSIVRNSGRFESPLRSFKEGGVCEAYGFMNVHEMAQATLELIDRELAEGNTVTVQSRVNFTYSPASILYAMQREGDFNLLGDVRSLNTARYRRVWQLIELVQGRGVDNLKTNLKVLDPEITNWDAKSVAERFMNVVEKGQNVLVSYNCAYLEEIAYQVQSKGLLNLVEKLRGYLDAVSNQADEMVVFRMLLDHVLYYGSPQDAEAVGTVLTLADESESVNDFYLNMDFVNNKINSSKNNGSSPLTFATPFGFKGREADVNIVFDDSDGVFPYTLSSDMNFEEERRIHFVAGTRGKKKTYYFTRIGKESPFLLEMGLPINKWKSLEGYTLSGVEGIQLSKQLTLKERMEKKKAEDALLAVDLGDVEW